MNYAQLKALRMTVPIGKDHYHDEVFVRSILGHIHTLYERYGEDDLGDDKKLKDCLGYYYKVGRHHHIFYLRNRNHADNIAVRAHEETHVLDRLGKLHLLAQVLLDEQQVNVLFFRLGDEIRAELGSLYALHSRGISPSRLRANYVTEDFKKALEIYRRSQIRGRRRDSY